MYVYKNFDETKAHELEWKHVDATVKQLNNILRAVLKRRGIYRLSDKGFIS